MADTKEFEVIRVGRSDGTDTGPGYWPVVVPSTTAKKAAKEGTASEKAPRPKPQMVRLSDDDPRFVEWRIKLGILLKQEVATRPDGTAPTLRGPPTQATHSHTHTHTRQTETPGSSTSRAATGSTRDPSTSGSRATPSKQSCSRARRSSASTCSG